MDLTTVAGIVAFTMVLVQIIKELPYLKTVSTKILAIVIGVVLTVVAFYLKALTGNLPALVISVVIAILGAPTLYEIFNKPEPK